MINRKILVKSTNREIVEKMIRCDRFARVAGEGTIYGLWFGEAYLQIESDGVCDFVKAARCELAQLLDDVSRP